jgi:hypothetical protein
MEPRPTPFGRGNRPQPRPTLDRPATQGQLLEIRNGIWDLQQARVQDRDTIARLESELERAISALSHLDSDVYELKHRPAETFTVSDPFPALPGIEPDWAARGEAWEQIVAGLTVYVSQGVTGNALAEMIGVAVLEVERRTGFDAGVEQ